MSTSALVVAAPRTTLAVRLRDYVELTKPRIAVLELVVVATAAVVATWGTPEPATLWHAMVGTLLVAASASAANQWLERGLDGRMKRTANRPLPAGRLGSAEVLAFSALTLLAGCNTIEGVGRDIERAGDAIQDEADDTRDRRRRDD